MSIVTTIYKATVEPDDTPSNPSRRGDGAYLTSYTHESLTYVEHWKMHLLMDFPKATVNITVIKEEKLK